MRFNDVDTNIFDSRPVREQPRRQYVTKPTINPDKSVLTVLQVQDNRAALECSGLHDHVQVRVVQPRITLRNNVHAQLEQWVETPVLTFRQQSLELAIAEQ